VPYAGLPLVATQSFLFATLSLALFGCSGSSSVSEELTESVGVHVEMVALDNFDSPVVVLEENEGSRVLHIWIGPVEAQSIAIVMADQELPRPNTHDLGVRLLRGLQGEIDRVVVNDMRRGVYFAVITLRNGNSLVEIDARPSDAIAIALRVGAPIFVNPALFEPQDTLPRFKEEGRQVRVRGALPRMTAAGNIPATLPDTT